MNIKRYLMGNVSFHYSRWDRWGHIGISRYWSGRLIYFHIGKFNMTLDCRLNVMGDIVTGKVQ